MIIDVKELELYTSSLGHSLEELKAMDIGEKLDVGSTENKIKRHTESEWIFLRFDSVHTHIKKAEINHEDTHKVWTDFKGACDFNLKYGESRCEAVKDAFDENAATNIVSSSQFMQQQVKTTNSFLTGESGFTRTLEKMADFICFAKFDNAKQAEEYEDMKAEKFKLEQINKRKRKEKEEKKIARLKDELKDTPYSSTKKLTYSPAHMNMASVDVLLEATGGITANETPVSYSRVDNYLKNGEFAEGLEGFWERVSPKEKHDIPHYTETPVPFKEMAMDIMIQYQKEIDELKGKVVTPNLAKVISNLKSEKKTALESLRKVITVNPTGSIDETIPQDSWDRLSFRNTDTYIALLFGYYDACKKYNNKPSTNYWAILRDFENLLEKVEWTKEEAFVIQYILETGITEHKEIQEELMSELGFEIPQRTLSDWLLKHIPNKLLQAHEQLLEDWIWIHRRKGKYKTCSKCGKIKLAVDDRYFRKHPKGKLGLQSKCRACENEERLRNSR